MDNRRLLTISCAVLALVLQPFSLVWSFYLHSRGGPFGNFDGPTLLYYLTIGIALLAGVVVFLAGRSRMRWFLLVVFLPCLAYCIREATADLVIRLHL